MLNNRYKNEREVLKSALKSLFSKSDLSEDTLIDEYNAFIRKTESENYSWLNALHSWKELKLSDTRNKRVANLAINAWIEFGTIKFTLPKRIFIDDVKRNLTHEQFIFLTSLLKDELKKFILSDFDQTLDRSYAPKIEIPNLRDPAEIRKECIELEKELRVKENLLKKLSEGL